MSELLVRREEGVLVVTLNRPEKANALNETIYAGLVDVLKEQEKDEGIRAVVLASAGEKAFSAGADLKQFAEDGPATAGAKRRALLVRTLEAFIDFPKPLVAALQAQALGAGLMLAALADEVVAAEGAKLGMPEMKHGMPSPIGIAILVSRMGRRAAERLVQSGEPVSAAQGTQLGLVDCVVSLHQLEKHSLERAGALGALSARAFAVNKRFSAAKLRQELDAARRYVDAA